MNNTYAKAIRCLCLLYAGVVAADSRTDAVLPQLQVPAGFKISVFADNVPNARSMALGDDATIYVGTRNAGNVYALQDSDQDGISDKRTIIAKGLNMPNGVAFKQGALYVAEKNRIIRYDNIGKQLANPPAPVVIYNQLPNDNAHGWKYLRFGPDGKLYTAVGAPCNICEPSADIYGSLVRLNVDGSGFEILAQGIRNTVGFDWHPVTGQLFFTENGADGMGDDVPEEELNLWSAKGQHFGFPYCHAKNTADPIFGSGKSCETYVAPLWTFAAHMAPLGARFYTGNQFPAQYKNRLFVAEHGSWDRSKKQGYRVVAVEFNAAGNPIKESVFVDGWLTAKEAVLGRPVDILELPDGSLLISDDELGVIYKVQSTLPPPMSTADCLFSYAEVNYPTAFSGGNKVNQQYQGYEYRYYKDSHSYLGIYQGTKIDVLQPRVSEAIVNVGTVEQYKAIAACP